MNQAELIQIILNKQMIIEQLEKEIKLRINLNNPTRRNFT